MSFPLWWWLVVGAMALAAGFLTLLRFLRSGETRRTREGIAGDLHDDVAPTLASIALYAQSLKQKLRPGDSDTAETLEKISILSMDAVDALSDVVWAASPRRDSLNDLLTRMKDFTSQICNAGGVSYEIDFQQIPKPPVLRPEVRKNLYLIFKEALTNSVRHSGSTSVHVSSTLKNKNLCMVIKDNGKGFVLRRSSSGISVPTKSRKKTERGHGLRSMEKRARAIGAQLSIKSTIQKGTITTLNKRI